MKCAQCGFNLSLVDKRGNCRQHGRSHIIWEPLGGIFGSAILCSRTCVETYEKGAGAPVLKVASAAGRLASLFKPTP